MRRLGAVAACGVVAYVAIDVALVFLRPGLSVLHNAESDYGSAGRYAWLMDLDFLLRCSLTLAAVGAVLAVAPAATRRLHVGTGLVCVWAIASGLLAFFPDDPVGTRLRGVAPHVHLVLAGIAFVGIAVGARVSTRALRADPAWRPVAVLLTLLSWGAIVPILLLGRAHLRLHSLGGLYEKVFLGMELAWLLAAALWAQHLTTGRVSSGRVPSPNVVSGV